MKNMKKNPSIPKIIDPKPKIIGEAGSTCAPNKKPDFFTNQYYDEIYYNVDLDYSVTYFRPNDSFYMPVFYKDDEYIGFVFFDGKFDNVRISIKKETIKINSANNVNFDFEVIKNPNKLSSEEFQSLEFFELMQKALNDLLVKVYNWEQKEKNK